MNIVPGVFFQASSNLYQMGHINRKNPYIFPFFLFINNIFQSTPHVNIKKNVNNNKF